MPWSALQNRLWARRYRNASKRSSRSLTTLEMVSRTTRSPRHAGGQDDNGYLPATPFRKPHGSPPLGMARPGLFSFPSPGREPRDGGPHPVSGRPGLSLIPDGGDEPPHDRRGARRVASGCRCRAPFGTAFTQGTEADGGRSVPPPRPREFEAQDSCGVNDHGDEAYALPIWTFNHGGRDGASQDVLSLRGRGTGSARVRASSASSRKGET
jgi:hypothetical protein